MATRVVEIAPERYPAWRARFDTANPDGPQRILAVARFDASPLAVLLVRRGGYAVGVAEGTRLLARKVGTRHVQSRTAAGGWSQQRFARRRANQADELVGAVAEHLARLLRGAPDPAGVLCGGDRGLVRQVLADPRLTGLAQLPRHAAYDIPDPDRSVLEATLARCRAVRVTLEE